jgi:antitoxin component YwqK of YwqJK toxin-antitoxin module
MTIRAFFLLIACASITMACSSSPRHSSREELTRMHIVDRNDLSETITTPERLKKYSFTDFSAPQPYKKVARTFKQRHNGDTHTILTSYYENGQQRQHLEAINNRALGAYKEWHPNGKIKLSAYVIGGAADLTAEAEEGWMFEGATQAWDEKGNIITRILYAKGLLNGTAYYYYDDGKLWKDIPYDNNEIHGTVTLFYPSGAILSQQEYRNGSRHGPSRRFWKDNTIAAEEAYNNDALEEGDYYDSKGENISAVKEGAGFRAIFGATAVRELHEYRHGIIEGSIKVFDESQGLLIREYHSKKGLKHGEEIEYFPGTDTPRISLSWRNNAIQGTIKTWYDNGALESKREFYDNKKNGLSMGWYRDRSLMIIEEYDSDALVKGGYFEKGKKKPLTTVSQGSGTASLFDEEGFLIKKIIYKEGLPE